MVNHKRKYYRAALEKEVIFIIIPCVKKESNRRAFLPVGCFVMDFKYQRTTLIVFAPMRTRNMPWLPSATLCSVAAVLS